MVPTWPAFAIVNPMRPLRVLVAPDSFKGTMTAKEAAEAIKEGWLHARPQDEVITIPMADGGEGTLEIVHDATPGSKIIPIGMVTGPDGRPTPSHYLKLDDTTALVELAVSSGITHMKKLDPLGATTRGLGETIRRAIEDGMQHIMVALGGSASTDAGIGALQALGLEVTTDDGTPLKPGGGDLHRITGFDTTNLIKPPGGMTVLVDTRATFLEATRMFGPQKGATPGQIAVLERGFENLVERGVTLGQDLTVGTGAAGGTGWGLSRFVGASLESGAEIVTLLSDLSMAISNSDIVISGEGQLDSSSFQGKTVGTVVQRAKQYGVKVGLICGRIVGSCDIDSNVFCTSLAPTIGNTEFEQQDPKRTLESASSEFAASFGA